MNTRQNSEMEIQHRLSHITLTYFAAIDDKTLTLELYENTFSKTSVIKIPSGAVQGPAVIFESQVVWRSGSGMASMTKT